MVGELERSWMGWRSGFLLTRLGVLGYDPAPQLCPSPYIRAVTDGKRGMWRLSRPFAKNLAGVITLV